MNDTILRSTRIAELLRGRPVARAARGASIDEAAAAMAACPHGRTLYVVDDGGRLVGSIAVTELARHMFVRSHAPRIHGRGLVSDITTQTAADLAQWRPLTAAAQEPAGEVLDRMIAKGVEEIAVIDDEGRLLGDINLVDLLGICL